VRRFAGFGFALTSAAAFGSSGTLATGLLAAGWSPGGAVTVRVGVAAAALTVPALWQVRGRLRRFGSRVRATLVYGVLAVAGAQLCYFNAVAHLSVAVALLLEYSGVLLVVGWQWTRYRQRPTRLTTAGAAAAAAGLALVLGLFGGAQHIDLVGVLWGLGAAVGLASYFVISATEGDDALPPLATAWAGLVVGALALLAAAATGALTLRVASGPVRLGGHLLPWWAAIAALGLVAAALAYVAGVAGARRLGARLASFVGLCEVLFAAGFAWLLLGQALGASQLAGGALVIAGIALVRAGEPAPGRAPRPALTGPTAEPPEPPAGPPGAGRPARGARRPRLPAGRPG
jgi:drug/metabolite transporter (DMT)-like permease